MNVPTGETPSTNQPGFTVWPAQSPGILSYELGANGTEYFLSSNAADEATHPVAGTGGNYTSSQIVAWALTNTASLDTATPSIALSNSVLGVSQYALPPKADQQGSGSAPTAADSPQGYCLNNETTVTIAGTGCWKLLVGASAHARGAEVVSKLDSNDTRMQQVTFANGKIWGALDTAVSFDTTPAHNKALADAQYPSARVCGECHPKQFDQWSISSHAYAAVSPMFNKFEQTINDISRGTVNYFCVRCHASVGTSIDHA